LDFYRQRMKQFSILMIAAAMLTGIAARAEDAATTERLDKLNGYIQDLQEDKAGTKKQLADLSKEIQSLREEMSKPKGNYASADDLRKLAEKVEEIDKKRVADNDRIVKEIEKLGTKLAAPPKQVKPKPVAIDNPPANNEPKVSDKGFEHIVQSGQTLGEIIAAYNKEKGLKLKLDQVLKANPGLNPNAMKVNQKIFIPAP